jgi:hypothetical protein
MNQLARLADLLRQRNCLDEEIGSILGRPVHSRHIAEYVAAAVFGIDLNVSASARGHDGRFESGPLAGRTVNVKYGSKRDGNLNLTESSELAHHPDFYLVLTGPRVAPISSRGTAAPWVINSVYLFESNTLLAALAARGVRPGTAASVVGSLWQAAEIYPDATNEQLLLTPEQVAMLALFS